MSIHGGMCLRVLWERGVSKGKSKGVNGVIGGDGRGGGKGEGRGKERQRMGHTSADISRLKLLELLRLTEFIGLGG